MSGFPFLALGRLAPGLCPRQAGAFSRVGQVAFDRALPLCGNLSSALVVRSQKVSLLSLSSPFEFSLGCPGKIQKIYYNMMPLRAASAWIHWVKILELRECARRRWVVEDDIARSGRETRAGRSLRTDGSDRVPPEEEGR